MEVLDKTKVIEALRFSSSPDRNARHAAESMLVSYEGLPHFLLILLVNFFETYFRIFYELNTFQEAILQKGDDQTRLLAAIYLKVVMQKLWKSSVVEEEKQIFRTKALDLLSETHPQVGGRILYSRIFLNNFLAFLLINKYIEMKKYFELLVIHILTLYYNLTGWKPNCAYCVEYSSSWWASSLVIASTPSI